MDTTWLPAMLYTRAKTPEFWGAAVVWRRSPDFTCPLAVTLLAVSFGRGVCTPLSLGKESWLLHVKHRKERTQWSVYLHLSTYFLSFVHFFEIRTLPSEPTRKRWHPLSGRFRRPLSISCLRVGLFGSAAESRTGSKARSTRFREGLLVQYVSWL